MIFYVFMQIQRWTLYLIFLSPFQFSFCVLGKNCIANHKYIIEKLLNVGL